MTTAAPITAAASSTTRRTAASPFSIDDASAPDLMSAMSVPTSRSKFGASPRWASFAASAAIDSRLAIASTVPAMPSPLVRRESLIRVCPISNALIPSPVRMWSS